MIGLSDAIVGISSVRVTSGLTTLTFPLVPPQRRNATGSPASRQDELDGAGVPVLVVQGENDRFGMPVADPGRERTVVRVRGDHRLASDRAAVRTAVGEWVRAITATAPVR